MKLKKTVVITSGDERFDHQRARAAGQADADRNIPPVTDTEAPGWIDSLVSATKGTIRESFIEPLQEVTGKLDIELRQHHDYLARHGSDEKRSAAARIPTLIRSAPLYWGILLVVAGVEIVLNANIFLVIGEETALTYAMAAGLTALLFVVTHFTGHLFRVSLGKTAWALVIVDVLAAVGVLYIVAQLRVAFFGSLDNGSVQSAWLYYGINLFMFLAAFTLAMLAEPEIEKIDRKVAQLEEQRKSAWKKAKNQALALIDFCRQLFGAYREANDRARGTAAAWSDPDVALPDELDDYETFDDIYAADGVA